MAHFKMILTWDIRPGREQEYSEYINNRFAPSLVEIGLPPSDVFYTAYGKAPQIMVILEVPNRTTLRSAISSKRWTEMKAQLLELIENYNERVIEAGTDSYF